MAAPDLYFIYNHGDTDVVYTGSGAEVGNWKVINTSSDKMVFTGGGIIGTLSIPTCASGTRDATIRPSIQSYIIPQTYIESDVMYNVPLAGRNSNRYVFGVYIDGTIESDLYLEAWDDATFSTTASEVLQGSANNNNMSCINAIRTTDQIPTTTWSGSSTGASYLRGTSYRVGLANTSSTTNSSVYYNIYVQLETDTPTFHNESILGFRYLYT